MKDVKGKLTEIEVEKLYLVRLEDIGESIIGLDFLRNERITLFLDPKNSIGYIKR